MAKKPGMNPHQKRAHQVGERRVSAAEVAALVEKSRSEDAEERLLAAQFLCPCHVRRRLEPAWEALYRLLEDPDPRVRRFAWHTLDDGGRPEDPRLDAILQRAQRQEEDPQVLRSVRRFAAPRSRQERLTDVLAARPPARTRGRCDFCGENDVLVDRDLETMIPTGGMPRAAWICAGCARS
jgi:HEAT repeat protein